MSEFTDYAAAGGDDATWHAALLRDGYSLLPGLVAGPLITAANDTIQDDLTHNFDPALQVQYDYQSYCPNIRGSEAIRALLENAAVTDRIDSAVEYSKLIVGPPQIAIRRARNALVASPPEPHIDGVATAYNGVVGEELLTFTLLFGVFLGDISQEYAGNFTVWPGSHHRIEHYFRERGQKAMHDGVPQIPVGEPLQIHAMAGDAILCHYQLAHAAAVNLSARDRIAVYFRLSLTDIAEHRWHRLTHIWDGWRIGPRL
jgi:hypothetical protein